MQDICPHLNIFLSSFLFIYFIIIIIYLFMLCVCVLSYLKMMMMIYFYLFLVFYLFNICSDNQICLDMIEKRPTGILPMTDEELRLPKGSDDNLLTRLHKQHKGHKNYAVPKFGSNTSFVVAHYAGEVIRCCCCCFFFFFFFYHINLITVS